MEKISFATASADEKEQLLGPEFRNIHVLDFKSKDGVMVTRILLGGKDLTLIGDPQEALKTHLGGQSDDTTQ